MSDPFKQPEKIAKRERQWLLGEYSFFGKLQTAIKEKDRKTTSKIAKLMGRYERRLNQYHTRVLDSIQVLKEMKLPKKHITKILKIEEEIHVFESTLKKELSTYIGDLHNAVENGKWSEIKAISYEVEAAIKGWIALDKKLVEFEIEIYNKSNEVSKKIFEIIRNVEKNPNSIGQFETYLKENSALIKKGKKGKIISSIKNFVRKGVITIMLATVLIGCVNKGGNSEFNSVNLPAVTAVEKASFAENVMKEEYIQLVNKYKTENKIDLKLLNKFVMYLEYKTYKGGMKSPLAAIYKTWNNTCNTLKNSLPSANQISVMASIKADILKGTEIYNAEYSSIIDVFIHQRVQCSSGTKLTVLSYFNATGKSENVVLIYTVGHVQPGIFSNNTLVATESTDTGLAIVSYGTTANIKATGKGILVVDASLALFSMVADGIGDHSLAGELREKAIVFTSGNLEKGVGGSGPSTSGLIDPFAFGKAEVPAGDIPMTHSKTVQPFFGSTADMTMRQKSSGKRSSRQVQQSRKENKSIYSYANNAFERSKLDEYFEVAKSTMKYYEEHGKIINSNSLTNRQKYEELRKVCESMKNEWDNNGDYVLIRQWFSDFCKIHGAKMQIISAGGIYDTITNNTEVIRRRAL